MVILRYVCISILVIVTSGCVSKTPEDILKRHSDCGATLSIRDHVFASQPLWESELYLQEANSDVGVRVQNLYEIAPGLAGLRAHAQGQSVESFKVADTAGKKVSLEIDYLPPAALVQTKVMKAFIDAMTAQVIGEYQLQHGKRIEPETKELIDKTLTFKDFWDFHVELANTGVAVFQTTPDAEKRRPKVLDCPNDGKVRWHCLFMGYLSSYYNGKFVDREGGVLSKPKIGMVITNETITGLATAVLEATYDWVIVTSKLKVPVVYTGKLTDMDPGWQTANGTAPTFATVLLSMQPQLPEEGIKPFVEPLSDGTEVGISKLKLCGIRLVSGLAADSAQSLSGAIVRLFGGASAGPFVVFKKFSFGDNETIAKLVDTFVEVTSRRLTAGAASHLVYDVVDNDLPDFIPSVLKLLAECK